MKVDAVITELEIKLETSNNPYGSYVCFRFVDTYPSFPKVNEMLSDLQTRPDVDLVSHEMSYTGIHEDTDLSGLYITYN